MTAYAEKERARYWPVSRKKLMAQYRDGSHSKNEFGYLEWYQNDKLHRDGDKPAIIYPVGTLYWYQNGQRHRDYKPAYISANGDLRWFQNNKLHRACGPAAISSDGELEWWVNSEEITHAVRDWLAGEEWCGTAEQIVEFQLRFA